MSDAVLTCFECGEHGFLEQGTVFRGNWYCNKCATREPEHKTPPVFRADGTEIRYTPEAWIAAGGILTDDTPVWLWLGFPLYWGLFDYIGVKETSQAIIIAHPEQKRPDREYRP